MTPLIPFLITGPAAVYLPLVLIALGAGFLVFADEKGTADHKFWGRFYFLCAFSVSGVEVLFPGGFATPFQFWLPVLNLVTLFAAFATIRIAKGDRNKIKIHGLLMSWSFAFFLAAGISNLLGALPEVDNDRTFWVILIFLVVAGVGIHTTVPKLAAKLKLKK